jgi:DNA repair exonuclease SbcCD nuclease subunit
MVLHGELSAQGGVTPYGPVTAVDIAQSGLDYVALGHIHKACLPQKAGNCFYAYSGCPQGQGFDETGEKGVLVGTVEKGNVNLSLVPTAKRRYEIVKVDVGGASTCAQAAQKVRCAAGDLLSQHLVRAVLCGEVPAWVTLTPSLIEKELDDAFYIELEDKTTLAKDFESLAREQSLQGLFVAKLLRKIEEAGDDANARRTAELALRMGLAAMAGEEVQAW